MTLTIGIGEAVTSIDSIQTSYQQAREMLENKFLHGSNRVYSFTEPQYSQYYFPLHLEDQLIQSVKMGNGVSTCLDEMKQSIKQGSVGKDHVEIIILGLLSRLYQSLLILKVNIDERLFVSNIKEIQSFETSDELFAYFENILYRVRDEIDVYMVQHNKKIILKAQEFIKRSYMDENIGLNEIAGEVGFSPPYLSSIYKKETGTNVSEYLLETRMKKARELLGETDLKITDVCSQVGYANQYYFSASFKKHTGFTPKEFRNSVRRQATASV